MARPSLSPVEERTSAISPSANVGDPATAPE